MSVYPKTVEELLKLDSLPVVAIDQESIFTFINKAFTDEYGWEEGDLIGKSVTLIMPDHMHNAHTIGFSRYLTTEKSELLGKPLPLSVKYKKGTIRTSVHYIISDKKDGVWRFAAIIDYPVADD